MKDGSSGNARSAASLEPQREIPAESILAQLDKVLASPRFAHTERMRRFLRLTVEETLKGNREGLKEYQIGVRVFDRKDSYDPRLDPIVRVEASRLRSKLKEFYEKEGRDDPILIDFHKGSYAPVFGERDLAAPRPHRLPDRKTVALLAATLLALAGFSWAVLSYRDNLALRAQLEAARRTPLDPELAGIWSEFLAPEAKNFVVFGSPLFFAAPRQTLFLRWGGLNEATSSPSDPQLQAMQKRFGPFTGPRWDYTLTGDAIALQQLTAFFGRAGASLTALPAHRANWELISDGNIVFLGAPRMIPLLSRLPVQQDFEWDAEHNVINRNPQPGEEAKYVTPSHWEKMSYAILASNPGLRPRRRILLLTAHSAPGILAAVDQVTQIESVRALNERLAARRGAPPRDFQALLRVVVDQGSRVKTDFVTHHLVR